jgi:hypothetical protein
MKGNQGYLLTILGIGTFVWSMYNYRTKEFGSMWCLTSILYGLIAILI